MTNIHDFIVYKDNLGNIINSLAPIDLYCIGDITKKITTGLYDISNPASPVKVYNESPTTKYYTEINDCDGSVWLVENHYLEVLALLEYACDICNPNKKDMPTPISFSRISFELDNGQSDFTTLTVAGVIKIKNPTIVLQTPIADMISVHAYVIDNDKVRVEVENQTGNDNVVIPQLDFIITQI